MASAAMAAMAVGMADTAAMVAAMAGTMAILWSMGAGTATRAITAATTAEGTDGAGADNNPSLKTGASSPKLACLDFLRESQVTP